MNQENPNELPEEIQRMVDSSKQEFEKTIDRTVRESNETQNRYEQALRVFQEAADGDQAILSKLAAAVEAESMHIPYEHEQRIMDAARFLVLRLGDEVEKRGDQGVNYLVPLCGRAFDELLKEPSGYFKG
ncbi:MAG: hypothetical protein PHY34_05950 [Patescibacteria group bacterium]|nr:hypothetical protein [Patescibacteria group bacterium]MDD5716047.1 hypothetical protein [Patescibacteria group bacterium]